VLLSIKQAIAPVPESVEYPKSTVIPTFPELVIGAVRLYVLSLIIEDGSFGACFSCVQQGGVTDNQILKQFGVLSIPTASTLCTYDGVVDVTFFNSWTNPTITVGNLVITYSGSILDGFYLHLSTQNYNGNVSSLVVDNTVSGFDSSNLTITGSLINGNNSISYSGNNINGLITYNSINKYHN